MDGIDGQRHTGRQLRHADVDESWNGGGVVVMADGQSSNGGHQSRRDRYADARLHGKSDQREKRPSISSAFPHISYTLPSSIPATTFQSVSSYPSF